MAAGENGITRGTCFVARRLEVVVVAGLWISRCVFGPGRLFSCFFFLDLHVLFPSNAHALMSNVAG